MKFKHAALALAAVLMAGTTLAAAPALAQPYDDDDGYYQDDGQYADDGYRDDGYDRDGDYDRDDDRAYDDRSRYDDRYDANRSDGYQDYYRNGRYDRRSYDRYDGRGRHASCRDNRAMGTVLGGIAGAVIGSNVDDDGNRAEGTVLGAILGGVVGNQIGRSTAACDQYGQYYEYRDTYPFRAQRGYRGRYSDYGRRGCRLAVSYARSSRGEYVVVCPDRYGRYRVRY